MTAARSERGLEMVAKCGDWWFVDYGKDATTPDEFFEGTRKAIADMRARARRYGRTVRFALNPFIYFGSSADAALEEVKSILEIGRAHV